MKEIDVKVCLGTACFTKGSLTMNELLEIVPHKYGKKVKLSVSNCLGVCSINWEQSKAPYVKVNNEIISEATVLKVLAEIERQLNAEV